MVDLDLLNVEELETLVNVKKQLNQIIIKNEEDLAEAIKSTTNKIFIVSTDFSELAFNFTDTPFTDIKKAFQLHLNIDIGISDFHYLAFKDINGVNSFLKDINISHFLLFIKDGKEEALVPTAEVDFKNL